MIVSIIQKQKSEVKMEIYIKHNKTTRQLHISGNGIDFWIDLDWPEAMENLLQATKYIAGAVT